MSRLGLYCGRKHGHLDHADLQPEVELMPFRSAKQRRALWAKAPAVARKWTKQYGSKPKKKGAK